MIEPTPTPSAETVLGLDPRALLGRAMDDRARGVAAGVQLGDYELLHQLAQGGMGVIYVARQISLHRIVALKMIRSGLLATPEEVTRFRREAEAAASLDHPHIVPIYEIGEEDGQHFFSMKLLEGGNLAELNTSVTETERRGHTWVRRAVVIVSGMARAVHHAHQRGLLHRDIKPTNVLLDEHGEPHLTDFGLAKLVQQSRDLTLTLTVMGTPGYMAPEQAAGNSKELTIAADIYSLGAVLYELLTGRPPFEGETTLDLLRQVQESEPQSLRKSNPGLNRDLETICLKCLQKEPPRRYATAEELAADLERWRDSKPILARPVGPLVRFWLWSRRNPVAAMAGVLLLALAAVSTLAALRLRAQRNEINESLRNSLLSQARMHRLSTAIGRRPESLRILTEAARIQPSMEVRNEVIASLALPDLGPPEMWYAAKPQPQTHQRMLTAAGTRYAIFGQQEGITVYRRADGGVIAELVTPPQRAARGGISRDGRFVINFDLAGTAFVWDLNLAKGGPLTHSLMLPGPWEDHPDFLPDSRSIALMGRDKRLRFLDLETGVERSGIDLPFVARFIAISPAGDHVAMSVGGSIFVWRISPATQIQSHRHHSPITSIVWHPLGRFVAVGYASGDLQFFDSATGASRWQTPHRKDVDSMAFEAHGEMVVSASFDSTHRYFDPATGVSLFETKETGGVQGTGDGRCFALFDNDGSIGAREILRSAVFRTFSSARTGYPALSGVDISPDGRWLVSGDRAGLHVWEMARGNEVAFVASASAWGPRFHPDGQFIVTGGAGKQLRWPFSATADSSRVRAGPPEELASVEGSNVSFTPDGQWLAATGSDGSVVLNWNDPSQRMIFGRNPASTRHNQVVLSPDRKWVAGAAHGAVGVTVWNARDGSMLRQLIALENADLAVSPDGRTLATVTGNELVLWDSMTWEPRRRMTSGLHSGLPVPIVFSRDGLLLAVALTRQEIHLLDAHTGDPRAVLTPPISADHVSLAFSSDGRHLAARTEGPVIHLWDLHALRGELRTFGLDW